MTTAITPGFAQASPKPLPNPESRVDKLLAPTEDWHMEDQRAFNELVMDHFYPTRAAAGDETDGDVVLAANGTLRRTPLAPAK